MIRMNMKTIDFKVTEEDLVEVINRRLKDQYGKTAPQIEWVNRVNQYGFETERYITVTVDDTAPKEPEPVEEE